MENEKSKIMVVDDESQVVQLLGDFLSSKGYEVSSAGSGEEALAWLEKHKADVVLLDLIMPGLKGTQVAKIVKRLYPNTKIVVITAYPKESAELCDLRAAEAVLTKPFALKELEQQLNALLIHPKRLTLHARILFVEPTGDAYQYLRNQFQRLALRGQYYETDLAQSEGELFRKAAQFRPDFVVFDTSFLQRLDPRGPERMLLIAQKTKETLSCNLLSIQYDYEELEKLAAQIRELCITHHLIKVL